MHILAALTEGTTPPKTVAKEKDGKAVLDFETAFMDVDAQTTSEGEVLLPTDVEVDPDPDHDVPDEAVLKGYNENKIDSVDAKDVPDLADLDLSDPELPTNVPAKPDPSPQVLTARTTEQPQKHVPNTATPAPQNAASLVQNEKPLRHWSRMKNLCRLARLNFKSAFHELNLYRLNRWYPQSMLRRRPCRM